LEITLIAIRKFTLKQVTFLLILVSFSSIAYSQREREQIKFNTKYSVAKIYLRDFTFKKVRNLTVADNGIATFNEIPGNTVNVSLEEFQLFKIKKGTNIVPWAVALGAIGATSVFYASKDVYGSYLWDIKENKGRMTTWFTLGGAAIGGIIGAVIPRWKTLNIPKINANMSYFPHFISGYSPKTKVMSIKLNINF
jgi:hypothetical protein